MTKLCIGSGPDQARAEEGNAPILHPGGLSPLDVLLRVRQVATETIGTFELLNALLDGGAESGRLLSDTL